MHVCKCVCRINHRVQWNVGVMCITYQYRREWLSWGVICEPLSCQPFRAVSPLSSPQSHSNCCSLSNFPFDGPPLMRCACCPLIRSSLCLFRSFFECSPCGALVSPHFGPKLALAWLNYILQRNGLCLINFLFICETKRNILKNWNKKE